MHPNPSVAVDTHVVVLDVNIYLDTASLVGPPFTWDKFNQAASRTRNDPLPHPTDPRVDSLRALAVCISGNFDGYEPLEVWTSTHIDALVIRKANQPTDRRLRDEDRGLGWTRQESEGLLADLVDALVYERTSGATVGEITVSEGSPPLSHEDGRVLRTAMEAGDDHTLQYIVTQDQGFRDCSKKLPGHVTVLNAHQWVLLLRNARGAFAASRMAARRP